MGRGRKCNAFGDLIEVECCPICDNSNKIEEFTYDMFYDKISSRYYNTHKIKYPEKPSILKSIKINTIDESAKRIYHSDVIKAAEEYNSQMKLYREEESNLTNEFRNDSRKYIEYKLNKRISNLSLDAIYNYAWSEGHAYGYSEIFSKLNDIIDLAEILLKENN